MSRFAFLIAVFLLASLVGLSAQSGAALSVTTAQGTVNGVIETGEYSVTQALRGVSVSLARYAGGRVRIAVSAETAGWVAVGLGTSRMSGAHIFIGNFSGNQATVREDRASGYSHAAASDQLLIASSVAERAGVTVLEVELNAASFLAGASLPIVLAYGRSDSFSSMHAFRTTLTIPLQ